MAIYEEGVFVGYRYFDTKKVAVSYPFGYGLSYTTFQYDDMTLTREGDQFRITCKITNTGKRPGREVAQLYVAAPGKDMVKPAKELKSFAKTDLLQPGASQTLTMYVPVETLASFDTESSSWQLEGGTYSFKIGASSADIRLEASADVDAACVEKVHAVLQLPTSIPTAKQAAEQAIQ